MPRTSIAVVDSKRLVAVFGPRDQHLRRIREALGVGVSARDDAIHIEGDEEAVRYNSERFSACHFASPRGVWRVPDLLLPAAPASPP